MMSEPNRGLDSMQMLTKSHWVIGVGAALIGLCTASYGAADARSDSGLRSMYGNAVLSTYGSGARSTYGSGARSTYGSGARSTYGSGARSTYGSGARSTY